MLLSYDCRLPATLNSILKLQNGIQIYWLKIKMTRLNGCCLVYIQGITVSLQMKCYQRYHRHCEFAESIWSPWRFFQVIPFLEFVQCAWTMALSKWDIVVLSFLCVASVVRMIMDRNKHMFMSSPVLEEGSIAVGIGGIKEILKMFRGLWCEGKCSKLTTVILRFCLLWRHLSPVVIESGQRACALST